jgi:hypothetical protein
MRPPQPSFRQTLVILALLSGLSANGPCYGQRNPNTPPRVMLGVRFVGDTPVVSYIKPNGPAFKAGIEVGDEIFSVNDRFVLQARDLVENLTGSRPGDKARVEVRRDGEYRFFDLTVMLATRDGQRVAADGTILPPPPEFGMVGEKAPQISVRDWQNLPHDATRCQLEDFSGKVIVILLFQSTCVYSAEDGLPLMATFYQRYKDDPEVQFLAVQASFPKFEENTLENGVAMLERSGLSIPVGQDVSDDINRTVCKQLKALGTPWFVMIDRQGIVKFNGMPEDVTDADVIERIKRGETVMESSLPETMTPAAPAKIDDHDDQ